MAYAGVSGGIVNAAAQTLPAVAPSAGFPWAFAVVLAVGLAVIGGLLYVRRRNAGVAEDIAAKAKAMLADAGEAVVVAEKKVWAGVGTARTAMPNWFVASTGAGSAGGAGTSAVITYSGPPPILHPIPTPAPAMPTRPPVPPDSPGDATPSGLRAAGGPAPSTLDAARAALAAATAAAGL